MNRFLLISFAVVLTACSNLSGPAADGATAMQSYAKVYDHNNAFLGYCTSSSAYGVNLYSTKGYYYSLLWSAELMDGIAYFTEEAGNGTAFIYNSYTLYGKMIISTTMGLYSPKDLDTYGNALSDSSITNFRSFYMNGSITNYGTPQSVPSGYMPFAVTQKTRTDAGIPNLIVPPIRIEYSN